MTDTASQAGQLPNLLQEHHLSNRHGWAQICSCAGVDTLVLVS